MNLQIRRIFNFLPYIAMLSVASMHYSFADLAELKIHLHQAETELSELKKSYSEENYTYRISYAQFPALVGLFTVGSSIQLYQIYAQTQIDRLSHKNTTETLETAIHNLAEGTEQDLLKLEGIAKQANTQNSRYKQSKDFPDKIQYKEKLQAYIEKNNIKLSNETLKQSFDQNLQILIEKLTTINQSELSEPAVEVQRQIQKIKEYLITATKNLNDFSQRYAQEFLGQKVELARLANMGARHFEHTLLERITEDRERNAKRIQDLTEAIRKKISSLSETVSKMQIEDKLPILNDSLNQLNTAGKKFYTTYASFFNNFYSDDILNTIKTEGTPKLAAQTVLDSIKVAHKALAEEIIEKMKTSFNKSKVIAEQIAHLNTIRTDGLSRNSEATLNRVFSELSKVLPKAELAAESSALSTSIAEATQNIRSLFRLRQVESEIEKFLGHSLPPSFRENISYFLNSKKYPLYALSGALIFSSALYVYSRLTLEPYIEIHKDQLIQLERTIKNLKEQIKSFEDASNIGSYT